MYRQTFGTCGEKSKLPPASEMSLDDLLCSDDRLASVFGTGRVLLAPAGTDISNPETVAQSVEKINKPTQYIKEKIQKFEEYSEKFSQLSTRTDFIRATHSHSKTQVSMEYTYEDKKYPINTSIQAEHVKSQFDLNLFGTTVKVPVIKSGYLTMYSQKFTAMILTNLEQIADIIEGLGKVCDIPESVAQLEHRLRPVAIQQSILQ